MSGFQALERAFHESHQLTEVEVELLERELLDRPEDAMPRARLINYYLCNTGDSVQERQRHHVFWVIEHAPGSALAWILAVMAGLRLGATAIQAFKRRLDTMPGGSSAAGYAHLCAARLALYGDDKDLHRAWRERARSLLPGQRSQAKLDALEAEDLYRSPWWEPADAPIRLARLEKLLARRSPGNSHMLDQMARLALDAGLTAHAQRYAEQLLGSIAERKPWDRGNAHYDGHAMLGRVALRGGDVPGAVAHLMLSAQTPGSPTLCTFGPSMLLAKELLEHDAGDAVLAFFRACESFFAKHGKERLDEWTAAVRAGRMPDFGGNLL